MNSPLDRACREQAACERTSFMGRAREEYDWSEGTVKWLCSYFGIPVLGARRRDLAFDRGFFRVTETSTERRRSKGGREPKLSPPLGFLRRRMEPVVREDRR